MEEDKDEGGPSRGQRDQPLGRVTQARINKRDNLDELLEAFELVDTLLSTLQKECLMEIGIVASISKSLDLHVARFKRLLER